MVEVNNLPDTLASGKHVYLRKVSLSDVTEDYYQWMNDEEVTRHLQAPLPSNLEDLAQYVERNINDSQQIFLAIVLHRSNLHVGNLKIGNIDRQHRCADMSIMVGDKRYWGQGIASESLNLVVSLAFDRLQLIRLTASIVSSNVGSIKAFGRAGFTVEGLNRSAFFRPSETRDYVLVGISRIESI